jgi:hypothetical protein
MEQERFEEFLKNQGERSSESITSASATTTTTTQTQT